MFGILRNRLEAQRSTTLSEIQWHRLAFETMAQCAQKVGDQVDNQFVTDVLGRIDTIVEKARRETDGEELKSSIEDAAQQAELRAYLCPVAEICNEGAQSLALLDEWGVPGETVRKMRQTLGEKLKEPPDIARGALLAIFHEQNSWDQYTEDYERNMKRLTCILSIAMILLIAGSEVAAHFPFLSSSGLLSAGAAGSCASVLGKMPVPEVRLSNELDSSARRTVIRISVGAVASIIGCAMLGWGVLPISIEGIAFADVLRACRTSADASCTSVDALILLAVPMLFGFSERALTSLESTFFGTLKGSSSQA